MKDTIEDDISFCTHALRIMKEKNYSQWKIDKMQSNLDYLTTNNRDLTKL